MSSSAPGPGAARSPGNCRRLCRDGLRVAVLEWGPRLREDEYTGREVEMASGCTVDSGGVLTRDRSLTLAFGRAYGGSTVVYTGTSLALTLRQRLGSGACRAFRPAISPARSQKYFAENHVHLLEPAPSERQQPAVRRGVPEARVPRRAVSPEPHGLSRHRACATSAARTRPRWARIGCSCPRPSATASTVVTNCARRSAGGADRSRQRSTRPGVDGRTLCVGAPGRIASRTKAVVVAAGAVNSPGAAAAVAARRSAAGARPVLHLPSRAHPGRAARRADHELLRAPEELLLRPVRRVRRVPARDLHVLPVHHGEEPDGIRRGAARPLMSAMDRLQMILVLAIDPALPDNRVTIDRDGHPVVRLPAHARRAPVAGRVDAGAARASSSPRAPSACTRRPADGSSSRRRDRDRVDELIPIEGFTAGEGRRCRARTRWAAAGWAPHSPTR